MIAIDSPIIEALAAKHWERELRRNISPLYGDVYGDEAKAAGDSFSFEEYCGTWENPDGFYWDEDSPAEEYKQECRLAVLAILEDFIAMDQATPKEPGP